VGWAGVALVHRRHGDRLDARPQRPAPGPLARDDGRLGRARLRGRRVRRRPGAGAAQGALQPGKLFLVDLAQGRIVEDGEAKAAIAAQQPYGEWFQRESVRLADLPPATPRGLDVPLRQLQLVFGYTHEDMKVMLAPLAANAEEAVGSMGNDTPLAVLSDRKPLLYSYFKQLFAQVTNPPIDSIREAVVMSVRTLVGAERNLLDETPEHARQLVIDDPILADEDLERLRQVDTGVFRSETIDITWPVADGWQGLEPALERACAEADTALARGANILILSDRAAGPERVPIPSLLATAIHHHLVRARTRLQAGSSSNRASRAACRASRCSSATAPRR
jgi:Glutamate synthase central domain.